MRFKKQRGNKRNMLPEGFLSDFMSLQWVMYWKMVDQAKRQRFYKCRKRSRKAGRLLSARSYNMVREEYKKRGEWK